MKQSTDTNFMTSVLALTAEKYLPKLQENAFKYNAALVKLKEKNELGITRNGDAILIPLLLAPGTGGKFYSDYDTFDISPTGGIVTAEAKIKQVAVPITVSGTELRINSGKEQIISLMTSKMMQADLTLKGIVGSSIYGDGTSDGGKSITGFGAMIEASATPGAYLGVTNSDYWVNQYATGSSGQILSKMSILDYATKDGADSTDLILCDDKFAILYEAANQSTSGIGVQYVDSTLADAGFKHIMYKGIPMVVDKNISASVGEALFLNTNYIGFLFEEPETTEFVMSQSQVNCKSAFLNVPTQLFTNNRRRQGKIVLA